MFYCLVAAQACVSPAMSLLQRVVRRPLLAVSLLQLVLGRQWAVMQRYLRAIRTWQVARCCCALAVAVSPELWIWKLPVGLHPVVAFMCPLGTARNLVGPWPCRLVDLLRLQVLRLHLRRALRLSEELPARAPVAV